MKNMDELKEMLCDELDEIVKKGDISYSDLDNIEKITTSIKNIDKIVMADRYSYGRSYDGSYGENYDGNGMMNRSYRNDMRDGGSYASRGRHYVRGHYSYNDEAGMLSDKIEDMINDGRMSANDKRILKDALEIIRK